MTTTRPEEHNNYHKRIKHYGIFLRDPNGILYGYSILLDLHRKIIKSVNPSDIFKDDDFQNCTSENSQVKGIIHNYLLSKTFVGIFNKADANRFYCALRTGKCKPILVRISSSRICHPALSVKLFWKERRKLIMDKQLSINERSWHVQNIQFAEIERETAKLLDAKRGLTLRGYSDRVIP